MPGRSDGMPTSAEAGTHGGIFCQWFPLFHLFLSSSPLSISWTNYSTTLQMRMGHRMSPTQRTTRTVNRYFPKLDPARTIGQPVLRRTDCKPRGEKPNSCHLEARRIAHIVAAARKHRAESLRKFLVWKQVGFHLSWRGFPARLVKGAKHLRVWWWMKFYYWV